MAAISQELFSQLQQEAALAEEMLKSTYSHLQEDDPRVLTATNIRTMIGVGIRETNQYEISKSYSGIFFPGKKLAKLMSTYKVKNTSEYTYTSAIVACVLMNSFAYFSEGIKKVASALDPTLFPEGLFFHAMFAPLMSFLFERDWHFSLGDPIYLMRLYKNTLHVLVNYALVSGSLTNRKELEIQINIWKSEKIYEKQKGLHKEDFFAFLISSLIQLNLDVMKSSLVGSVITPAPH